MKSIQTKLTVTILSIFLVALSILGGLNYWKARDILTQNITSDLQKQVVNSVGDVSDWLETRKAEMTILSVTPAIQSGNTEAIAPFLANAAKANKVYDAIGYIAPSGSFINSGGATGSLADRDYFPRAMKGETVISDPMIAKSTGHLVSVVAIPVKVDGRVTGVLYGSVDMGSLSQKVMDIKIGQTGYGYLINSSGLTIVHPSKDVAMKVNALQDNSTSSDLKAAVGRMVKGEIGLGNYDYQGVRKILAFAPVEGTSWSLAVTVPMDEMTGAVSVLTSISLVTIITVLVAAGMFIAWYARRIAVPIRKLEEAAQRIAAGDLRQVDMDINSNDEIGRLGKSFGEMNQNLRGLIQRILGATDQVAASSEELTASAEQSSQASNQVASSVSEIADGADKQLAAVNETTTAVEQIADGIQHAAAGANEAAAQSAQVAEKTKDGGQAVEKAISQMSQIEGAVNSSSKVVTKLGERSKEIGQIVDTISGIAGQTNLLALNAAIEAARAGEQGRGFAVVAEEVRKLAEQSQEAAKKIADLIGEIQGDTDRAVVAMNDGTREVKTGAEVVNAAGIAFREIAELVSLVSSQSKDSSAGLQQMAGSSQQIVNAVKKIDELSKKSAGEAQSVSAAAEEQLASMEEIASSSEALAKLAQDLQAAVAEFRL